MTPQPTQPQTAPETTVSGRRSRSGPRIGGLFFGYGGLDMAVQSVLGGELAWVSEIDPGACKVIDHRFPGVPNLGDITKVDWSSVEPVDILTGGSPCQDLSGAGKRAGMTEGTRSNLWVAMREAIAILRPRLVIWENVRGAFSACADSAMGRCPRCVDPDFPGGHAPWLRALGRVLGDLSDLGYDAQWHGLRAADIGAPHGRFRVFVAAYPRGEHSIERWLAAPGQATGGRTLGEPAGRDRTPLSLMPTPSATDGIKGGPNQRGSSGDLMLPSVAALLPTPTRQDGSNDGGPSQFDRNTPPFNAVVTLLPTPAVNDMGEGKTVEVWDEWTAKMQAKHGNGNGHGKSLSIEAQRLLPTTTAMDAHASGGNPDTTGTHGTTLTDATVRQPGQWGQYAVAIHRWETLTRPAPAPTEQDWDAWHKGLERRKASRLPVGMRGSIRRWIMPPSPRLSPRFSEWMMGLPAGWVTDVPGITRGEALKLAGNGVVPQQAAAAWRLMLGRIQELAA